MQPTDGPTAGSDTAAALPPVLSALRQRAWSGWTSVRNLLDVLTLRTFNLSNHGAEVGPGTNNTAILFQESLLIIGLF
jgi:hypothetical protein